MRTELIYWVVSAPLGILLIMAALTEALGASETLAAIVGLTLLGVYLASLGLIVVTFARGPADACVAFFRGAGFQVKRTRVFGRRFMGAWHGVPAEVRFLAGAGGIPSQLEARSPPNGAWLAHPLTPVVPERIEAWLDRISERPGPEAPS